MYRAERGGNREKELNKNRNWESALRRGQLEKKDIKVILGCSEFKASLSYKRPPS